MIAAGPGVLHVVANLDVGGAQEVVRTLVPYLAREGFRPVVATLRDGALRAPIEASGVPVEVIGGRRHAMTAPHRALPELRRIRRDLADVVARHGIAIVQTHLLRSLDFLVLTLRREPGVQAVFWTVHNSHLELRSDQVPPGVVQRMLLRPKRAGYRLAYRTGARMGDGFVAVSDEVAVSIGRAIRPPAQMLATIANGVDVERYPPPIDRAALRSNLGLGDDQVLFLSVGKLMRQKGHAVLIEALRQAATELADVVVLVAGEGELRTDLEGRIAAAGIADRIRLLGARRDVPQLLAAADAFVLPSLWEGLPMALLEAMASRLPVLATEVSGTSQVVETGTSGLLVSPGDVAELASGLRELSAIARDADRARTMGDAARARIETHYSARAQARAHAELYRAALARHATATAPAEA
jgi:glycosyltransferase involved in cell wall biosynthesis